MDDLVLTEATDPVKKQVLDSLGNKFVTAEAVKAGADFGFARRTVMYMLKDFCQRTLSSKTSKAIMRKFRSRTTTLHRLHFALFALLHKRCCILCQTSAKVQKVQGAISAEPYE